MKLGPSLSFVLFLSSVLVQARESTDGLDLFVEDNSDLVIDRLPVGLPHHQLGLSELSPDEQKQLKRAKPVADYLSQFTGLATYQSRRVFSDSLKPFSSPPFVKIKLGPMKQVSGWRYRVLNYEGETIHIKKGEGPPSQTLSWDGRKDDWPVIRPGVPYTAVFEYKNARGHWIKQTRDPVIYSAISLNQGTERQYWLAHAAVFRPDGRINEEGRQWLMSLAHQLSRHTDQILSIQFIAKETKGSKAMMEAVVSSLSQRLLIPKEIMSTDIQVSPTDNQEWNFSVAEERQ